MVIRDCVTFSAMAMGKHGARSDYSSSISHLLDGVGSAQIVLADIAALMYGNTDYSL